MRKLWILSLGFAAILACSKKDKPTPEPDNNNQAALNNAQVVPGQTITILFQKLETPQDTFEVSVGGQSLLLVKLSGLEYAAAVPVLPPGNYTINSASLKLDSGLLLKVLPYSVIEEPKKVIDSFNHNIRSAIDSLQMMAADGLNTISAEAMDFVRQLPIQLEESIAKLSATEKLQIAYTLRQLQPDMELFRNNAIDPAMYTVRVAGDAGDYLVQEAKKVAAAVMFTAGTVPSCAASLLAVYLAPPHLKPYAAAVAIACLSTYIVCRDVAAKQAAAVGRLPGVLEAITDMSASRGSMAVDFELENGKPLVFSTTARYRSINSGDGNHKSDIVREVVTGDNKMVDNDKKIAEKLNQALGFFSKLVKPFVPYTAKLKGTSSTKSNKASNANLIVRNVSNNKISLTYERVGQEELKLVATSTTLAEETEFTVDLVLQQPALGTEAVKTLKLKYKGIDTLATLINHGSWKAFEGIDVDGNVLGVLTTSTTNSGEPCRKPLVYKWRDDSLRIVLNQQGKGYVVHGYEESMDYIGANCAVTNVGGPLVDRSDISWQYIPASKVLRITFLTEDIQDFEMGTTIDFKIVALSASQLELQVGAGQENWQYKFR